MKQDDDFVNYVQESVTAEVPLDTLGMYLQETPHFSVSCYMIHALFT